MNSVACCTVKELAILLPVSPSTCVIDHSALTNGTDAAVQRQAVASSAAIAQEAMFLVDGLSSTGDSGARLSSTAGCLRLLSAQATRDALKQVWRSRSALLVPPAVTTQGLYDKRCTATLKAHARLFA